MMAVTSELCLKPPDDSCNVCGLKFYDVWALIFPGTSLFYAKHHNVGIIHASPLIYSIACTRQGISGLLNAATFKSLFHPIASIKA
jgi:hypothetical protein